MKRWIGSLILFALLILQPASVVQAQAMQPIAVERIFAENRYLTSCTISYEGFDRSSFAVIASGENFPDALAGSQLAGYLEAPLLITPPHRIDDALKFELRRLGVKTVYLLGGTSAVSNNVAATLQREYRVIRLAGANRLQTSQAIANELIRIKGTKTKKYYASSANFPDALAAGPMIVKQNGILHLAGSGTRLLDGTAIGGSSALPGTPRARIAGKNRYETAVAIAKSYPVRSKTVLLASGANYPDALSAAGLAARHNYPILLTDPRTLSPATAAYLKEAKITRVIILGGSSAISDHVLDQIRYLHLPAKG